MQKSVLSPVKDFQDIQKEYDFLYTHEGIRDEQRAYAWHAKRILNNLSGTRFILDLACGEGHFLREMMNFRSGISVAGIDISHQALLKAKEECPRAHLLLGVAEYLPFKDQVFDAIVCLGSLEHFLDIPKAIHEMIRVAKDEALIEVMVPNLFWYQDILSVLRTGDKKNRNQHQEMFATIGEWKRLLGSAGLQVLNMKKYNGIARNSFKQLLKDLLIPRHFSYHFIFQCAKAVSSAK